MQDAQHNSIVVLNEELTIVVSLLVDNEAWGRYWPGVAPENFPARTLERLDALGQDVHIAEGQEVTISGTASVGERRSESRRNGITHRAAMPPD